MTLRRCQSCKHYYDKKLLTCPECAVPKYEFNKSLRTAALNNHLYESAARAG